MKLCATCKHWIEPENEYGEVPNVGRCSAVVMYWDATEWDEDGDGRKLLTEYTNNLAFVQDGSDYIAHLKTMPTFGCVQHEDR